MPPMLSAIRRSASSQVGGSWPSSAMRSEAHPGLSERNIGGVTCHLARQTQHRFLVNVAADDRKWLEFSRESLVRLCNGQLISAAGVERFPAGTIETSAMFRRAAPRVERERPSGVMGTIDRALEPPVSCIPAFIDTGEVSFDRLSFAFLDEFFRRLATEGRQRLRPVPGKGLVGCPCPLLSAIDDLDHVTQPCLYSCRLLAVPPAQRFDADPQNAGELGLVHMQLLSHRLGIDGIVTGYPEKSLIVTYQHSAT